MKVRKNAAGLYVATITMGVQMTLLGALEQRQTSTSKNSAS